MNCDEVAALLGAEVDGEVDALRSHALRRHVAGCTVCRPRLESMTEMQRRLRSELPYHAAPPALRARLAAELEGRGASGTAPARRWQWFGSGALAGSLAMSLLWFASSVWQQEGTAEDLPTRLVGLHTRATLGHQLVEVASSDRHTVKPWLSERLDYTIPVIDAADAGFALLGARIDRLDGGPVAVLVYRHRRHMIDVVVRPLTANGPPIGLNVVRGFNVVATQGAQMSWLAVSDLNGAELAAFATGLAKGQVDSARE